MSDKQGTSDSNDARHPLEAASETGNRPGKASSTVRSASFDPLIRDKLFADPASVFTYQPKPLQTVKDSAIVVVDANVLLLPYNASHIAFKAVVKTYEQLVEQGRLRIPAQAASSPLKKG